MILKKTQLLRKLRITTQTKHCCQASKLKKYPLSLLNFKKNQLIGISLSMPNSN